MNLLETFPDRGKVALRLMDEIHVQLLQSQLEEGQYMTNRYYTKIRHLIQTGRNGLLYIPAHGIFGGEVEVGPIF